MPADATVALVAATCASISVAPFLMASTAALWQRPRATPRADLSGIGAVAGSSSPNQGGLRPTRGVDRRRRHGGTYFAKNFADVLIERRGLSEARRAPPSSARRQPTTWGILKDAAFARWFGAAAAATAAPAVIPKTSYALFAARIASPSAAFVAPTYRAALTRARAWRNRAGVVCQLVSRRSCKSSARRPPRAQPRQRPGGIRRRRVARSGRPRPPRSSQVARCSVGSADCSTPS